MGRVLSGVVAAALCAVGANAFTAPSGVLSRLGRAPLLRSSPRCVSTGTTRGMSMMAEGSIGRREALATSALTAFFSLAFPAKEASAAGVAMGYGVSEKEMNDQITAFGLKPFEKVQGGFKPLIQAVGGTTGANIDGSKTIESLGSYVTSNGGLKSGERLLVLFQYPSSWIVNLPITTPNGESGTVSANNYVKGDSAVVSAKGIEGGASIDSLPKDFYQGLITQFLTQDGYQGFKVLKKSAGTPIDGQPVVDIEYKYDLILGGNSVGRHGFAKCIQCSNNVVALGATTTDGRFKKLKDDLSSVVNSFRAHIVKAEFEKMGSGLNFQGEPGA